jgi:hypothetical protein
MIEQIISDTETTENVDTDANKDVAVTPLAAFWAEHRLLHKQDALREFLGTETIEDLDDVHPGDLQTMRAVQWAQATLSVAEANRLARAVQGHHAEKLPLPVYGPQWFPAHGGLPGYLPAGAALMCENHV